MRTFYIATALFTLFVLWLLNKPIPKQQPVARAFNGAEIDYLEKSFDYAMDTLKEGEYLDWSAAAVNGRISVGKVYESGKKATCRKYVEVARTYDAQKVDAGVACKRVGKDGWCRVHGENPQSCALEVAESSIMKQSRYAILQGSQMLDAAMAKTMGIDVKGMTPSAPQVGRPGVPSLGQMPEFQKPEFEPGDFRPPMPWDPAEQ
jgi:hypothetical protein